MASLWKSTLSVRCMSPTRVGGTSGQIRQRAPSNSQMLQEALGQDSRLRTFTKKAELNSDVKPLDSNAVRSSNSSRSTSQPQRQQVQSLKTSVLNQVAKLKNMSPDIAAFAKTVAVMHSELPHYLPSYQKLLPQSMRIRVFPAAPQVHVDIPEKENEIPHEAVPCVEEIKSQSSQLENNGETEQKNRRKHGVPLQVSNHSKAINRETTDFTTAMLETNTSVQMYHNTVAGESTTPFSEMAVGVKSTTDAKKLSTPKSKVWSTPSKENTAGWKIASYLPSLASQQKTPADETKEPVKKRELIAIRSIERRTRELVVSLRSATTNASKLMRLEEFSNHITKYPNSRNQAMKVGGWHVSVKVQCHSWIWVRLVQSL